MNKLIMSARYAVCYIAAVAAPFLFVEFLANYANNMGNIAIYATKGFEYLLILLFLAAFTVFFLYMTNRQAEQAQSKEALSLGHLVEWFEVPDTVLFHQGHAWAAPDPASPETVRVGLDDFAQRMVGKIGGLAGAPLGAHLRQGEKGWSMKSGNKTLDMLAPVSGRIVEVNQAIQDNPALLNQDPYGKGWIYKVRPADLARESKNLFSGDLAMKWMEGVVEKLRRKLEPEIGMVLQDGGVPVSGMAKMIDKTNWDGLLKEFFLTN